MVILQILSTQDNVNVNVNDNFSSDSNTTPSQIGDIITAVDGHPVRQIDDIINYIESQKNVKLTVNRDGKIMDLTATNNISTLLLLFLTMLMPRQR